MTLFDFLKTAFATLLVTLDPPGLAPIFIGLTAGMSAAEKREVALRGSIIAFCILAAFAVGGAEVMRALGISMPAFRIAGGVMLFWIAFGMIFDLRPQRREALAADAITIDHVRNVAAFPLAIPLLAGPGAITATILLASRAGADWPLLAVLLAVIATTIVLCYFGFLVSERLAALLGATGNIVLTRLLGIILAALAAQFVIDGIGGVGR